MLVEIEAVQVPTNRFAFLVITLDGNMIPPRICGIGIFSTPGETLTIQRNMRQRYVTVMQAIGYSYEDACAELMQRLEHNEFWGWSWHMLVGTGHAKL
jgi:hypothetical protein